MFMHGATASDGDIIHFNELLVQIVSAVFQGNTKNRPQPGVSRQPSQFYHRFHPESVLQNVHGVQQFFTDYESEQHRAGQQIQTTDELGNVINDETAYINNNGEIPANLGEGFNPESPDIKDFDEPVEKPYHRQNPIDDEDLEG
jgi:hypothetical protein